VPFGNDVIYARDGEVDNIDCGVGTDRAVVDTIDVVANCETVDAAGSGGGGNPPGGGGGNPPGGGGTGALVLKIAKVRLAALAGKGLTVGVACPAACKVAGTLGYKGRTVGSGRRTSITGGTTKVRLKLTKAGRKALRKARRAKLTVKVSMTPASGSKLTASKTITVKR
jgi:hypothetical protein